MYCLSQHAILLVLQGVAGAAQCIILYNMPFY